MCRSCCRPSCCGSSHHAQTAHQHERRMPRRLLTKEGRAEQLNHYKEALKKELQAVEERINKLESE